MLGLVPYDFRVPSFRRIREILWDAEDPRFVVPTFFGLGCTLNLRSAPRHPFQALLLVAFIWWLGMGRRG
jgi:hypothetical protein